MSLPVPARLELLAALAKLSELRPEWRLGQTVANVAMTAGRLEPGGLWDLEDEEALTAINLLIYKYADLPMAGLANATDHVSAE